MSTDVVAPTTAPAQAAPVKGAKKARSAGPKKPKAPANHPPVSDMVKAAITGLKERNGSSSQAIRKYIASNFKVDIDRLSSFIRRYLKSGVTAGALVQTKGKGAAGSFKLSASAKAVKKPKVAKKPKSPKKATTRTPKTAVAKKPKAAGTKKPKAAAKKPKTPKKPKAAGAAKSPAKKVRKPKAPTKSKVEKKPKAAKPSKPKAPKKAKAAPKK